MAKKEELTQ